MTDEKHNGSSRAAGTITAVPVEVARLEQLRAYYQQCVDALTLTIELLRSVPALTERVMRDALEPEAIRPPARGRRPKTRRRADQAADDAAPFQSRRDAQRARTAAFLAQFHAATPTRPEHRGPIPILIRTGYLQKKGDGYIRTAKAFTV